LQSLKKKSKICKIKQTSEVNDGGAKMVMNNSPIQMEWFNNLEGEKTKFNWFLLEIALEYYSRIMGCAELKTYRKQNSNKQIAQYCTYYARRAKTDLLKYVKGQRKHIYTYEEYIEDFYPYHKPEQNKQLSEVGNETWEHMLKACGNCPQSCLKDYRSKSIFFEKYK
jgi:hypothetical protein